VPIEEEEEEEEEVYLINTNSDIFKSFETTKALWPKLNIGTVHISIRNVSDGDSERLEAMMRR